MATKTEDAMSFVRELKRRNVFKVAAAYTIVAWILLQVSETLVPALHLPQWFHSGIAFLLIMGFPVAIIFAWAFELTPEGLKREKEVDRSRSITHKTGRKLDFAVIAVLAVAIVLLVGKDWFGRGSVSPSIASAQEKSIAVLPFENRSADAENAEFFAAGVHDELLTLLSRLGGLKVISRTSVERLNEELSIPEIGALLNVATVLEGQVQRAGDRLRINVQLISVTEEDHLWATTYDRELTASNIFDVQSNIARSIADELHVQLSANDDTLLNTVPTDNMEALQGYMLGRQLIERGNFDSYEPAVRYLTDATELDPNYALAWIGIAHAYNRMYQTGVVDLQEYVAAAAPAIARALETNNALPEAHAESAALRWQSGDVGAAEASFKTALELGPSNSQSLQSYGNYLRTAGRPQEAIPVLKRALEGNPLSVKTLFELGKAEMYSGQPEQFIIRAERILEIDPSSVHGYVARLQAYEWMGRYDLMWPWCIKSVASDPEDFELWGYLGLISYYVGATEWGDRYLDRALELGPHEPAVLGYYASVLEQRGQLDAAVEIARSALEANLDDRWQSNQIFLRLVRDDAMRSGNLDDARSWYLDRHPELFLDVPEITMGNINTAADLALLLQRAGESAAADMLIEAGLAWVQRTQPAGVYGYLINIVDVELLALGDQKQAALDTLQQAVDSGWKSDWPSVFRDETLASLRNESRFQQITAQLEDDMATQLDAIRALPDMGEFDLRSTQSN
jgi:TolB-like protein/Tfp pilus assembly protein PilF